MSFLYLVCLLIQPPRCAAAAQTELSVSSMFDEHGAVMLMIHADTGEIDYANRAAANFYGYSKAELCGMNMSQINILSSAEIKTEMQAALTEQRNFFTFQHRLQDGAIRTVEVFSYPLVYGGEQYLFSIIHDITEQVRLQERSERMNHFIFIAAGLLILLLLALIWVLIYGRARLRHGKKIGETMNALRQTFIDAIDSIVTLKDEHLRFVFINKAAEQFFNKKEKEVIGADDFELLNVALAEKRRSSDLQVLRHNQTVVDKIEWEGRIYQTTKFPVMMPNGKTGVGAYVKDITEAFLRERRQEKALKRHVILSDVMNTVFSCRQEQLNCVLHQALILTESEHGYIFIYDEEKQTLTLNSWTEGVEEACGVKEQKTTYQLESTGVWGEVIRQRRPIVVNDFKKANPLCKGFPEGHIPLKNFLSIPVLVDGNIVAVVGMANKGDDYDEIDIYEITVLMSGAWNEVTRREAQQALILERNKYRHTLISICEGVMVVNQDGQVEMLNANAEKLTGWNSAEAKGKHYSSVYQVQGGKDDKKDPIDAAIKQGGVQNQSQEMTLIAPTGIRCEIEQSVSSVGDANGKMLGAVIVFRDITDRKEQSRRIAYLSFHDSLTGLYNRRFFEEEMQRLDDGKQLPIAVIMADIDGLKMTNDVFGHAYGDRLLKSAAKIFTLVCREGDIAARWGGDEFTMVLPRTNQEQAQEILNNIKQLFNKERIQAIKGSISIGIAVKESEAQALEEVIGLAEKQMYEEKMLSHSTFQKHALEQIVDSFYGECTKEREHAQRVSKLCKRFGRYLGLEEDQINKLEKAAMLHDIGKIVLNRELFNHCYQPTENDWKEIRRHPIVGYRLLSSFDETVDLAEIVLMHQERWDGSGYPRGVHGEEIPLQARIIALIERYDRLRYGSYYSQAASEADTLMSLSKEADKAYDPRLTQKLIEMSKQKERQYD